MRQRDALGRSGRAAGELDIDGIVELQSAGECREGVAVARAAHPRNLLERNGAGTGRAADLDHRAQLRQPRRVQIAWRRFRQFRHQRVQHLHVVAGLERGGGDDRGAADLGEREFEFAQAVGGIDGDENEPGLGGGKLRQRPFRPVQRPDADPRAAFEAEREKARGQRIDPLGQFSPCPSDAVAWRNQRLAIGPAPRRLIEAASDGVAEQRGIGDAANITICCFGQVRSSMLSRLVCRRLCRPQFARASDRTALKAWIAGTPGPRRPGGTISPKLTPPSAPHRARHRRRARSPRRPPGISGPRTAAPASGSRR